MSERSRILVVDDERFNREIMQEILEPDYDVSYAKTGEECLMLAAKERPELILLDINMPGMNGYEVCEKLKANEVTQAIPVMFVSALDTIAERLAGYEVGGSDYITKPFESRELLSRIKIVLETSNSLLASKQQADLANSTAMMALTSTSELGVVLHFLQESFNCHEVETLAKLIVAAMQSCGLVTTVQIRLGRTVVNDSDKGAVSPLESTVIDRLCREGRIVKLGKRSIFNYEHVSILVKNMPVDDPEKLGRFNDNIALLAEGADARVQAIKVQLELKHKHDGLKKTVESTEDAMKSIGEVHEEHKLKSMGVLAELLGQFEESFGTLGLTEPQEQFVMRIINRAVADTIEIFDNGLRADNKLSIVMENLRDIVDDTAA